MINRALIAIAFAAASVSAAPAFAVDAKSCATTPAALRGIASNADADKSAKALRLVVVGEKLCAAGNRGEAAKKFAAAARALDTDLAVLAAPAVIAQ